MSTIPYLCKSAMLPSPTGVRPSSCHSDKVHARTIDSLAAETLDSTLGAFPWRLVCVVCLLLWACVDMVEGGRRDRARNGGK